MNCLDDIHPLLRRRDAPSATEIADMLQAVIQENDLEDDDDFLYPVVAAWNKKMSDRHWQRRGDRILEMRSARPPTNYGGSTSG